MNALSTACLEEVVDDERGLVGNADGSFVANVRLEVAARHDCLKSVGRTIEAIVNFSIIPPNK